MLDAAVDNSRPCCRGVTFEVTDKDTDPTQGTFNVTIVDDVPSANATVR